MLQVWLDNFHKLAELEAQREAVWWAMIAAIAAIASVAVSGLALIGLFRSLSQTRESLEENKRTGALERRPWLTVKEIQIGKSFLRHENDQSNIITEFSIIIENIGLSPAYNALLAIDFATDITGSEGAFQAEEIAFAGATVVYPPHAITTELRVASIESRLATAEFPLMIEVTIAYNSPEMSMKHKTIAMATVIHREHRNIFFVSHLPHYYNAMALEPLIHIEMS